MKRLTTIAMSLMLFLTTSVCESADWGTYHGTVQTEWVTDDERDMRLLSDFHYTGPRPSAIRWTAPTGAVVNGASIPPVFWPIIGSPFTGRYRNASVLHDVACDEKRRSWEEVHLMFYQAMRRSGVSVTKAKTMYWAVYHFGIRWRAPNAVERVFGVRGTEVRSSRVPEAPSRWSDRREGWTGAPQATVREIESPTPPPPANPARISDEELRRFERWVARKNPSISELKQKKP